MSNGQAAFGMSGLSGKLERILQRRKNMEKIEFGGAEEIAQAEVECEGDEFENVIRRFGVVAACEWFGHAPDSEFTKEIIRILRERSLKDN